MSVFDKVRSIFKKDEGPSKPGSPVRGGGGPKIWTMPPEMQREFEKGVKYNMKVVIRGMRKTGKSALLARLHGHVFPETYVPSPEISAATIRYQGIDVPEDHGTKVEMWDVVDVGVHAGGRGASSAAPLAPLADATTIDVYRNCHCVIFMVDPMRKETLEYVLTESRNVPPTAAILVALNFMDLPKPHAVTERDVDEMCRRLQRASTPMIFLASQGNPPERSLSAGATWVSISSRTSYGLQVLRSFFEIPVAFVHLAALETQMKTLYQKVEVHQAWMLSERARLNFEEKERSKVPSEESLHDLQPSPIASPHAGRPTPPPPAASPQKQQPPKPKSDGETILVVIPSSKASSSAPAVQQQALPHNTKKGGETMTAATAKKQQVPAKPSTAAQNSNELSNDFFGDVSDDDAPSSSSSSSSEEEQITPARRSGTAGPFATAAQRRNSPPTDQRSNEHPPRSQAPVNSVPASSTTTASGPPHSIPPPLPSKSQALIVERAPVLRDGDCVVDESNSKVNDDFFGSDESDEEESQGSPEPKAPQQASRGSSTSEADEVQATGPHQSPPAKVAPPAAAVGTSSGVAFGSAVASPSVIKDDFFGGGSDEEEETIPRQGTSTKPPVNRDSDDDEDEGHEHKRVSPPRPTRPAAVPQARALGTAPVAGARSGKVVERRAPPPVVTKTAVAAPVPSIDVSALLAQMQSAIVNAPPQEMDDEDPEHGADVEKSHKRAKEKKEKSAKREKKEKKKKRSKTEGDSDDEDGGFVVED